VIQISDKWKSKGPVKESRFKEFSTFQRIFEPANNVDRKPEDGCMNKIKIERSIKLRTEDRKGRKDFNIISGSQFDE